MTQHIAYTVATEAPTSVAPYFRGAWACECSVCGRFDVLDFRSQAIEQCENHERAHNVPSGHARIYG